MVTRVLGKWGWFLYLGGASFVTFVAFAQWAYDDPFITYRYADNLVRGLGFVYNPTERVLSTTAPLFTILLAALGRVWNDIPGWANLISAFSLSLGALFIWDLAQTWETPWAGWAGLILYPTFTLLLSTIGSEALLSLALCLGAFAFYARNQSHRTALCAALAILVRPDAALVTVVLAAHFLARGRRPIAWTAIALFAGILLPWFIFAAWYFGSPLPATLLVKQQQGAMAISTRFAPGLIAIWQDFMTSWHYRAETALVLLGAGWTWWRARAWGLVLAWTLLYFAAYTALGVSRYYWYYAPLVPGLVIAVGLGLSGLTQWTTRRPGILRLAAGIAGMALLLMLALAQIADAWVLRAPSDQRYGIYRAVGEWLQANTPENSTVGALEVGIIGYYARRPMIDFAGLIQPAVAARLSPQATYEDAALWAAARYRPAYFVLADRAFPRLETGYVAQHCALVQRFLGKQYGYAEDLSVYACN